MEENRAERHTEKNNYLFNIKKKNTIQIPLPPQKNFKNLILRISYVVFKYNFQRNLKSLIKRRNFFLRIKFSFCFENKNSSLQKILFGNVFPSFEVYQDID